VLLYRQGVPGTLGGTSASAPVFASIITRINEERLNAGKSAVGFINPTLYANPGAFNDITIGSNPNCDSGGFNAVSYIDSSALSRTNIVFSQLVGIQSQV
jgi:tripeptidyl-peptidase-1